MQSDSSPIISYSIAPKHRPWPSALALVFYFIFTTAAGSLGGFLAGLLGDSYFEIRGSNETAFLWTVSLFCALAAIVVARKTVRRPFFHWICIWTGIAGVPLACGAGIYMLHLAELAAAAPGAPFLAGLSERIFALCYFSCAGWAMLTLLAGICARIAHRSHPVAPAASQGPPA